MLCGLTSSYWPILLRRCNDVVRRNLLSLSSSERVLKDVEYKQFKPVTATKNYFATKTNAKLGVDENDKKKDKSVIFFVKEDNLKLFKEIANGDESVYQDLRSLQQKLDIASENFGVEVKMTKEKWLELLQNKYNRRKAYIAYLIANTLREAHKEKKFDVGLSDFDDDVLNSTCDIKCYHLFHNSMFIKFRERLIRKCSHARVMTSIFYGPDIVIDCSYENYMVPNEIKNLARQISLCMSANLQSTKPYNLVLCNFDRTKCKLASYLSIYLPGFYEPSYPIIYTDKCFLDLYPRKNLVYLSPHSNDILTNVDAEKTYIIGGYVDKTICEPVSLAKAKEKNIPMAKLPIDLHLNWKQGKKSLTVNHVFEIMLRMKIESNWLKAFEVVPQRHLTEPKKNGKSKSSVRSTVENIFSLMEEE